MSDILLYGESVNPAPTSKDCPVNGYTMDEGKRIKPRDDNAGLLDNQGRERGRGERHVMDSQARHKREKRVGGQHADTTRYK